MNVLQALLPPALAALLLLLGCTAELEPRPTGGAPLPALVAQRVTATIQREASRLVRVETEHESFLTTPEHPFATPRSGWISAGRLVPGDWVVSARFGAVRLLSVRSEPAVRPVPVFNLSVASSHAYFVGTDRVLVHNTACKPNEGEAREDFIARLLRMRDELNRQIKELTKTTLASPRITELRTQRTKLSEKLNKLRAAQRREQGVVVLSRNEKSRLHFEAEKETARKGLEDAQKELADLESRPPVSEAEKAVFAARKAALDRRIASIQLDYDRTNQIVTWLRELAELENRAPTTVAERRALEERKKELHSNLDLERRRAMNAKSERRARAQPEGRDERRKSRRDTDGRRFRTAPYLADTKRPRDPLELLTEELARLSQEAPSERRDARIHHLTEYIETKTKLVDVRRKAANVRLRGYKARRARKKLVADGEDSSEADARLEQVDLELRALRVETAQLRLRELLLTKLDGTPWGHGPGSVDEVQLRGFQRQLAEGLVNDQRLAEIERALDAMDPTGADSEQTVREEAQDVDETLRDWEELLHQSPSPAAGLQSSFERLQQELREERDAVEAAVFQLANESAFIEQTRAGSSSGPTWQERLRAIHQQQLDLRANWRAGLSTRLDTARQRLKDMQLLDRFRDEATEAELAREIALLERELQLAGGG